jgi:hypothetical protein
MAVVKGVKEKVHLPLYDAITLGVKTENGGQVVPINIREQITNNGNIIKFFVNIQDKTKLETNQQEAGVLSHYNTYEARAMRVILVPPEVTPGSEIQAKINAKKDDIENAAAASVKQVGKDAVDFTLQLASETADNTEFLSNFIYNSVTSFIVGEKVMIQAPTWFFPSGAGPSNDSGITNGTPSPEATFRFAEPVNISHQQNYRVEIEFPRGPDELKEAKGRTKIWVVVDGYLTRDVQ